MPKILPWSHSSLIGFDTCPRQYEEVKVLRHYQDQKNPASLWGDEFHKAAEAFIRANCADLMSASLPQTMLPYSGYLMQFITRPGRSEEHTSELQSRFDLVCRLL